jgi:F0F1-type ATP synthase membrane subunit c/vacuolar-type H+-ATPase subunit K
MKRSPKTNKMVARDGSEVGVGSAEVVVMVGGGVRVGSTAVGTALGADIAGACAGEAVPVLFARQPLLASKMAISR